MWKATQCTDQTRALQQSSPWILSAAIRRMTWHFPHQCARYRFELNPTMTQATRIDRLKAAESRKERRMEQKVSRRRRSLTVNTKQRIPQKTHDPKKYVSALVKEMKCPDYSQSKSNKDNKNNGKCKAKEALEEPSPKSSLETKYLDRWQAKTNKRKGDQAEPGQNHASKKPPLTFTWSDLLSCCPTVLCEEELPEVENEKFSAYSNSKSDSSKKLAPEVAASRSWTFRSALQLRRKTSAPTNIVPFNDFISFVLTPFVAALFIADDRTITVDEAHRVREKSSSFGDLHQENLRAMKAMPMNSLLSPRIFDIRTHLRRPELNPPDIYDSEYPKAKAAISVQDFKEPGRKEKKCKKSPKKTQRGPKPAAKLLTRSREPGKIKLRDEIQVSAYGRRIGRG
ncbi:hypothetical protein B0H19DRAFT_1077017 [Mycena capillaripes]|nr:hypothetical protein B0H19DRAFT_1077017 [Mycena capillaripes]